MAVLAQFTLTGGTAPTTTGTDCIVGSLTSQSLFSFTNGTAGYASDPVASAGPASGASNNTTAVSANSYFYFTISPSPSSGKKINLTSLTFNVARGGAATPRGYDIRTSIDSYAATIGTADISTQRTTFTAVSIDLTGSSYQNLTGSTTFSFYVYAPSTVNVVDFDDVTLNGTVADSGTVDQEGFRFRDDNGSETTATWLALQDVNIIRPALTNTRLRVLLDATLDRGPETYQLEFRPVGGTTWTVL